MKNGLSMSVVCSIMAKNVLKPGDRVGCTNCPGTRRVFTFSHWDGYWMVSKSGIDDYSPRSIYSINGVPADFTKGVTLPFHGLLDEHK